MDPLRRRKVRNVPFDDIADWFAADDPMPDFVVADVVRMADRLPSGQRDVVLATVVDGCSSPEVARRLTMSEGAVRVAFSPCCCSVGGIVRRTSGMRTDELIQVLARDVRSPAPRLEAQLWTAAALGSMLSLLAFALALGPRDDLITALSAPLFIGKVAVVVIFAATVASALPATARPGSALRWGRVLLAPVLVVLLATIDLGAYPADTWVSRLLGTNAYVCLTAIPLLALAPLLGLLLGLRSGAPTRPALAGGLAGVLAGALAASLYAFHCADDSPLFVATWYSLAILIVAGLGAAAGALMLRW